MLTATARPGSFSFSGQAGQIDNAAIRSRCLAYISASQKYLGSNQLIESYESLDQACGWAVDPDLRQQIIQVCKTMEDSGAKVIESGDKEFAAKRYTEAIRLYRSVCALSKLKTGATARAKIAAAEKDPGFAAVLRNAKAAEVYSTIHLILRCKLDPETAQIDAPKGAKPTDALLDGGSGEGTDEADVEAHAKRAFACQPADRVRLIATLDRVIQGFPESPSAKCAAALRERVMGDKAFADSVEKERTETTLRGTYEWAQQNERYGFFDKAAADYRKIIAEGAGTPWAVQAKMRLDALASEKKIKP